MRPLPFREAYAWWEGGVAPAKRAEEGGVAGAQCCLPAQRGRLREREKERWEKERGEKERCEAGGAAGLGRGSSCS